MSAIALHLNTTTTGSGVEEDFINKETNGTGDVIDSPTAVSSYNAASGPIAYDDREESTLGRAHLNEEK